jgi:hypothetical protein
MAESATGSTGRIFISYRREETAYAAGWLFDRLAEHFGDGQIFKDIDSIELGDDFVEMITRAVGSCDVLLALIGDRWLTITDEDGARRLNDPNDFVRVEIEAALTRNVRVIPILVDGARMPRAGELPPSLAKLMRRQALELSPARFDFDTGLLLKVLDKTLAEVRTAQAGPASTMSPAGTGPDQHPTTLTAAGSGVEGEPGLSAGVVSRAAGSGVEGEPGLSAGVVSRAAGSGAEGEPGPPTSIPVPVMPASPSHPDLDRPADKPPRRLSTRARILAGGGALAAVISLLIVIAVAKSQTPPDQTAGPAPGLSTSPTPQPTSRSAAPLPSLPKSAALSKSQMIVAMKVSGNWDLYLADESHNAPRRRLTKSSAADNGQMLSADRRTVIYMHDTDETDNRRTLRVAGAADGKGDRELLSPVPKVCNAKMYRPALSPTDPGLLAVPCTNTKGHWGLYLIRTDGMVVREIEQPGRAVDDPTFSPDGKELAFWSGSQTDVDGGNLYVTRVDKPSPPRRLTRSQLAGQDGDPTFSPSGDSIAFRRRTADGTTGGNADIYVIRADGKGGARRLTNDPATEQDPSYSPSGKRIAFQSNKWTPFWPNATVARAWIMNNDGANQRLLWTEKAVDRQATPAWSGR